MNVVANFATKLFTREPEKPHYCHIVEFIPPSRVYLNTRWKENAKYSNEIIISNNEIFTMIFPDHFLYPYYCFVYDTIAYTINTIPDVIGYGMTSRADRSQPIVIHLGAFTTYSQLEETPERLCRCYLNSILFELDKSKHYNSLRYATIIPNTRFRNYLVFLAETIKTQVSYESTQYSIFNNNTDLLTQKMYNRDEPNATNTITFSDVAIHDYETCELISSPSFHWCSGETLEKKNAKMYYDYIVSNKFTEHIHICKLYPDVSYQPIDFTMDHLRRKLRNEPTPEPATNPVLEPFSKSETSDSIDDETIPLRILNETEFE